MMLNKFLLWFMRFWTIFRENVKKSRWYWFLIPNSCTASINFVYLTLRSLKSMIFYHHPKEKVIFHHFFSINFVIHHLLRIKLGWSGENFHKANIFMNPSDAGYDLFAFSVSNRLILVKTLLYFQYKLTHFGKILFLFSYKSIDVDRNA